MKPRAIIQWSKADISQEVEEYFDNDFTNKFFKKQGLTFPTAEDFIDFCNKNGKYEVMSKEELLSHKIVNMTTKLEDFKKELENPRYRKNFESMINYALKHESVTLPSPTLFYFKNKDVYYGFAGNRRTNFAWILGNPVKYFVIYVK